MTAGKVDDDRAPAFGDRRSERWQVSRDRRAIDDKPRLWTTDQIETLRDIAAAVVTEIELRSATEAASDDRR